MGQYRSRLQIIADILMVVRNGARKTKIMYQANLSYRLLNQYLDYVMETDLLSFKDEGYYFVTPKGFEFLERYSKYSQRNKEVEEQLQVVANEKAVLEKHYIARSENAESRNSSVKKSLESSASTHE